MKHEESDIQKAFIKWINLQYPKSAAFIMHIPNGGKMTAIRGKRLKDLGVKAGVADILFMCKNNNFGGLWLEFKTKKGIQSKSQKEFENLCNAAQYDYQIVRNIEEAILAFKRYISLK